MTEQADWQSFTPAWLNAILGFEEAGLPIEQAFGVIGDHSAGIDDEIEPFARSVTSEIGGAPGTFAKTMNRLSKKPTQSAPLDFMNS